MFDQKLTLIAAAIVSLATSASGQSQGSLTWYAYCYTDDTVDAKAIIVTNIIKTTQNDFSMGGSEELRLEPKWRAFMKGKYNEGYTKIGCTAFDQSPNQVQRSIDLTRARAERSGQKFTQINWSPSPS